MSRVVASVLVVILASAIPAGASHNRHDHSPNVAQVSRTPLRWNEPSQDPQAVSGPTYVNDFAFQDRLVLGGVLGAHMPVRHPGEVSQSGLAVFKLGDEGRSAWPVGRFRCKTTADVSVWGDLAFQGALEDQESSTTDQPSDPCDRDGVRIIDISDPQHPSQAAFIDVGCGVGDHALVPEGRALYLYNPSSCNESVDNPWGAGTTSEMSVFKIDRRHPKRARVVSVASIFPMTGCSEVAVIPLHDLGVCAGDRRFILLDISDAANPVPIEGSHKVLEHHIRSVAFSWDGSLMVVGSDGRVDGLPAFQVFNVEDRSNPVEVTSWTPPATQALDVQSYSLSFVPMRDGRHVIVAAMGALGMRLVDVTDPTSPMEIGYYSAYDPGSVTANNPFGDASSIAAYWYNGYFYSSDFYKVRVFKVDGFDRDSVRFFRGRFNPQTQVANFIDE